MRPRFVIVPAVASGTSSARGDVKHCSTAMTRGFDVYDNLAKERLEPTYPSALEAEHACMRLNAGASQS